jgi:hypothetical protein
VNEHRAGANYEIIVRGRLGGPVTRSFRELEVQPSSPDSTCFRGWLPDQSALQAVLARFADMAIEVRSMRRLDDE